MTILPFSSGYRSTYSLTFQPTTNYVDVYDWIEATEPEGLSAEDFVIVIPRAEIVNANLFDSDAFDRFQETRRST